MHSFRIPQISALILLPLTCLGCSPNNNLRANLSAIHSLHDDTQAIGSIDATPAAINPKHHRRPAHLTMHHHTTTPTLDPTE